MESGRPRQPFPFKGSLVPAHASRAKMPGTTLSAFSQPTPISSTMESCWYHIQNVHQSLPFLPRLINSSGVKPIIPSFLNDHYSLLAGLPHSLLPPYCLFSTQQQAECKSDHITSPLKTLQKLPTAFRKHSELLNLGPT